MKIAAVAFALLLVTPFAASAYTIVMRDGRRIEVPDSFQLTPTTLTYEAAPGINITLQVRHINAAATERANSETDGTFLRRAQTVVAMPMHVPPAAQTQRPRSRTLRNGDLSEIRRAREASERAYERRRVELNLPAPLASAASAAPTEDETSLTRTAANLNEREAEAERYWRARAAALRAEIAALDGEINFLIARLGESSEFPALNAGIVSSTGFVGAYPAPYGYGITTLPVVSGYSNYSYTQSNVQIGGRIGFGGGQTRGAVVFNAGAASGSTLRRVIVPPRARNFAPFVGVFPIAAYPYSNYSSSRTLLVARLNELGAARAGFIARWQVLEDEARRAGALPGWLRQ